MICNFKHVILLILFLGVNHLSYAQWFNVGPGGAALSGVSFRTALDGWICGANGAIFHTTDGGLNWTLSTAFPTVGSHIGLLSISAPLQYNVTVLAQQPNQLLPTQVFYSTRNGQLNSFLPAFTTGVASDDFAYMSSHTDRLNLLVGPSGSLRLSITQGTSWVQLPSGTQNDLWGADSPDGTTYYLVGSKGTIRKGSYPGGVSQALNSTIFTRLTSVWFVTPQQGYVVGDGGIALRTANGGTTWVRMQIPSTANLTSVRFLDANTGFIVGAIGTLLVTHDGGINWQPENSNTFETLTNLFATPDGLNIWVVGGNGTVLKRGTATPLANLASSAGITWQVYPTAFTTTLTLTDLPLSQDDRELVLLDASGRQVAQQKLGATATVTTWSFTALPAGSYFLQLRMPRLAVQTRRLLRLPD